MSMTPQGMLELAIATSAGRSTGRSRIGLPQAAGRRSGICRCPAFVGHVGHCPRGVGRCCDADRASAGIISGASLLFREPGGNVETGRPARGCRGRVPTRVAIQSVVCTTLEHPGMCLARARETLEALTAFRRAIACDPQHLMALVNCGTTLYDHGELDEAWRLIMRHWPCSPTLPRHD